MPRSLARLVIVAIALTLTACGGGKTKRDGPGSGSTRIPDLPGDAVPRPEARSRYGNGPVYEVFGKRYTVMDSSRGYKERGVASWYGKAFHNKRTSNQEVYDMYAMTAAHKTLPLPTFVQVRNLSNNKTVVVRVNDRGPFVNNRIIDLSYVAAIKLDMVGDGTSLVEVTAINFDEPTGDRPTRSSTPSVTSSTPAAETALYRIYVQVGAFGDRTNAARRLSALSQSGISNAFIHEDNLSSSTLYRVRIGPVAGVVQYDALVEELEGLGITDPYLITD